MGRGLGVGVAVGAEVGLWIGGAGVTVGATVGAVVAGACVRLNDALGGAEMDVDGDGVDEDDRATPFSRTAPTMSMVRSAPATAASARSIQRGPARRGGGTSLVVSDTLACPARRVPRR